MKNVEVKIMRKDSRLNEVLCTVDEMTGMMTTYLNEVALGVQVSLSYSELCKNIGARCESIFSITDLADQYSNYSQIENFLDVIDTLEKGTHYTFMEYARLMNTSDIEKHVKFFKTDNNWYYFISRDSLISALKDSWKRIMHDIYMDALLRSDAFRLS